MSEETGTGTETSGTEKEEITSAPSKMPKKKLWTMIVAVIIVILLVIVVILAAMGKTHDLAATVSPATVTVDAGKKTPLSVEVKYDKAVITDPTDMLIKWSVEPKSLGDFDRTARMKVNLTAGNSGGTGTLKCVITYKGLEATGTAALTVNPPVLDSISIIPPSKNLAVGMYQNFTATAISTVGSTMTGVTFTWSVPDMPDTDYDLNRTTGPSVKFTAIAVGQCNLTVSGTVGSITKQAAATIIVGATLPSRHVDYRWYDMFDVPFGSWWDLRKDEDVWHDGYPNIFVWKGAPPGNVYYYSNLRLNATARNMSEINMAEKPEFLPFLGAQRGGNAWIDWYLGYMTHDEVKERFPLTEYWDDGWFLRHTGTTTLDKQAAMAVLGVTEDGYNDFSNWWALNNKSDAYKAWVTTESGKDRLDIWPMYDYVLTFLDWIFWAEKVGDKIVIHYDSVSWGMEGMMTRWMRESFMPTEWYFEDLTFRMHIGPTMTDADIDGVVIYGLYMYETTVVDPVSGKAEPCWTWEALMQDYLHSKPPAHPHSDFDPYAPFKYLNTAPGSLWYGQEMDYDYTPGTFNLTVNETMTFEWPAGYQLFVGQAFNSTGAPILGKTMNYSANMSMDYAEPMDSDIPGQIVTDNVAKKLTYIGPIDMYDWSKTQTAHDWLKSEWTRMGMLPYGAPYIEWKMESIVPPVPTSFEVKGVTSPIMAGEASNITVTVKDQFNNTFPTYDGTVNFTSTDLAASLPPNYDFTPADSGTHEFDAGVTFNTPGLQDIHVVDVANSDVDGWLNDTEVLELPKADRFVITDVQSEVVIDIPASFTLTVYDQYGAVYTPYDGTVNFTCNRTTVTLPINYTFQPGDAGTHVFATNLTFHDLGYYNLTVVDTVMPAVTGWKAGIRVVPEPPKIDHFNLYIERQLAPGTYYDIIVEAINQYGTVMTDYNGTVTFSTDAAPGTYDLPPDYVFVPGDQGNKTLAQSVSFSVAGTYLINVTDVFNITANGTASDIIVASWPYTTYKLYDMFEPEFGEWYWSHATNWRWYTYAQDVILSNESGKRTWLYAPAAGDSDVNKSEHSVIMAPYRWSMDARNVTTVNSHHPEFMPVDAIVGPVAGSAVSMKIYSQYISTQWWNSYWIPTWGWSRNGSPNYTVQLRNYLPSQGDGYLLGVTYDITLNREAAYEWLNLSTSADPYTWWASQGSMYYNDGGWYGLNWTSWIEKEANSRVDIYSGYDDFWYFGWNFINMTVNQATGEIILKIGEVDFGYEVLMCRWLREANLNVHEVYFEDLTMYVNYTETMADVYMDAVGTYNLHAVRANQSATNQGAWVWEPLRIDYVPSWNSGTYHPSEFDPYANLTYTSLNAGDSRFGYPVNYDSTPQWFNLSKYQKFIVQLPQGSDRLGFKGQGVPAGSWMDAWAGNLSEYNKLKYNGTVDLGYYVTGGVDLRSMYNTTSKTITMVGPLNFDYRRAGTGLLFHGAPWIEFNVSMTVSSLSAPETAGASASAGMTAESVTAGTSALLAVVSVAVLTTLLVVPRRRQ